MRPAGIAVIAVAALAALMGVLPALAADQTVAARDDFFSPQIVRVNAGDTVTFRHAGTHEHSLQFDDETGERAEAGTGWTATRTFAAAEVRDAPYTYLCNVHDGMTGSVYVDPEPSPTPTVSTTPTPTATASASPTPDPGSGPPPGLPARLLALELRRSRFCTRKGPRCRRPGVSIDIELSAAAEVRGRLSRRRDGRFRRFGSVDFGLVPAGPQRLAFRKSSAGRRLTPGRYRLTLSAAGVKRRLAFSVRASA